MRLKVLTWLVTQYTEVREHRSLGIFGKLLDDPYLFHLNERSVPGAFAVGLFCAWIPLPSQMIIAAAAAIVFRVNVPLSVLLVWITNPVTIPPMFYSAYVVGSWLTGDPAQNFEFQLSLEWMKSELGAIGEPLLIGCAILGITSSLTGYLLMRALWNERLSRFLHIKVERHQRTRKRRILKS
ncbi:MAG: DUF2062 domain-containing protein [Gammaproteobacteria bacterium]|nr:DUF2062 domain-containing protein [Gammaproteobacteria bacterium]